jgi:hypothetical protein
MRFKKEVIEWGYPSYSCTNRRGRSNLETPTKALADPVALARHNDIDAESNPTKRSISFEK